MKPFLVAFLLLINLATYHGVSAQANWPLSISSGITRVELAKNLCIDIKGEYPNGYYPRWERAVLNNGSPYAFPSGAIYVEIENFWTQKGKSFTAGTIVCLSQKDDKAVLILGDFYADIETNGLAVLTNMPQHFKLSNFRQFTSNKLTDKPLDQSTYIIYTRGGSGTVDLSANDGGDIMISFVIECYQKPTGSRPSGGVSYRYTLKEHIITNLSYATAANIQVQRIRQAHFDDSLNTIAQAIRQKEFDRLFEIKIKNSLADIKKLHNGFAPSFPFLKSDRGSKQESYWVERKENVAYVSEYRSDGSAIVDIDVVNKSELNYRTVSYKGYRNISNKAVIIKGIKKLKSDNGTIYYEDASIYLQPNDITSDILLIEDNYNSSKAAMNSVHYYRGVVL